MPEILIITEVEVTMTYAGAALAVSVIALGSWGMRTITLMDIMLRA